MGLMKSLPSVLGKHADAVSFKIFNMFIYPRDFCSSDRMKIATRGHPLMKRLNRAITSLIAI